MSNNKQQSTKEEENQSENPTDIVMSQAKGEGEEEQVQAVSASSELIKGKTNSNKLNKTLKKMEQVQARKTQLAAKTLPQSKKIQKAPKPVKSEAKKVEGEKDVADVKAKMLELKQRKSAGNSTTKQTEEKTNLKNKAVKKPAAPPKSKSKPKSKDPKVIKDKDDTNVRSVQIDQSVTSNPTKAVQSDFVHCNVCFVIKQESVLSADNPILTCSGDGCPLMAHLRCLGGSQNPNRFQIDSQGKKFTCLSCQRKNDGMLTCEVCKLSDDGLFVDYEGGEEKKDNKVIHFICGLLNDAFEVKDLTKMVFTQVNDVCSGSGQPESEKCDKGDLESDKCRICERKGGFMLRCLKRLCNQRVHPYCACQSILQTRLRELKVVESQDDQEMDSGNEEENHYGWAFDFKLQDYTQVKYASQLLGEKLNSLLQNQTFFDQHIGSNSAGLLCSPEASPQKDFIFRGKPQKNKLPSRVNLPVRGGKVNVVCEEHRHEPVHCCDNKILANTRMLMCDHCLNWYHNKCENLTLQETSGLDSYKCKNCIEWDLKYNDVFKQVLETRQSTQLLLNNEVQDIASWENWPRTIFPMLNQPNINLDVILLMASIWQIQSESLINNTNNVVVHIELIRQQIIQAQFIPLNLSSHILALNALITKVVEHEKIEPEKYQGFNLVEVINSDGIIDEQSREKNIQTVEKVKGLIQSETSSLCVKSYNLVALEVEVLEQAEIVEKAVRCLQKQQALTYEEINEIIKILDKKQHPILYDKITEVQKKAKDWLKEYAIITRTDCPITGRQGYNENNKIQPNKKSITDAQSLVKASIDIAPQINLASNLSSLNAVITQAEAWDAQYATLKDPIPFPTLEELHKEAKKLPFSTAQSSNLEQDFKESRHFVAECQKFLQNPTNNKHNPVPRPSLASLKHLLSSSQNKQAAAVSQVQKSLLTHLTKLCAQADTFTSEAQDWLCGKTQIPGLSDLTQFIEKIGQDVPGIGLDVVDGKGGLLEVVAVAQWVGMEQHQQQQQQMIGDSTMSNDHYRVSGGCNGVVTFDMVKKTDTMWKFGEEMEKKRVDKVKDVEKRYDGEIKIFFEKLGEQSPKVLLIQHIKETLENVQKLQCNKTKIEKEFSVRFSDIPDLKALENWLTKIYLSLNKILDDKKITDKQNQTVTSCLEKCSKNSLKTYKQQGESSCKQALPICSIGQTLLNLLQTTQDQNHIQAKMHSKKSKKTLNELLQTAQKLNKADQIKEIQAQIAQVDAWYKDFSDVQLPENKLIKELLGGQKTQDSLLEKVTKLLERKDELTLTLEEGEQRVLNKVFHWSKLVTDCRNALSTKSFELSNERIAEIENALGEKWQKLIQIPEVKQAQDEIFKINTYCEQLNEKSKAKPINLDEYRNAIESAKKDVNKNFQTVFADFESLVSKAEHFNKKADIVIKSNTYDIECDELLSSVENDKDGDYSLIDQNLHLALKGVQFRRLFAAPELTASQKEVTLRSAHDFSLLIKKNFRAELRDDPNYGCEQENRVYELARKIALYDSKNINFETNIDDAKVIVSSAGIKSAPEATSQDPGLVRLPFQVSKQLGELFLNQLTSFSKINQELQPILEQSDKIDVEKIKPLIAELQKLQIRSELEIKGQDLVKDYDFILDLWTKIDAFKQKTDHLNVPFVVEEAFENADMKRAMKIHSEGKFDCPQAQKIHDWYSSQKQIFLDVKSQIDQKKIEGDMNLRQNGEFQQKILSLSVDFGRKEQMLLVDLWHHKVGMLIREIMNLRKEGEEEISCDTPKYWLEEFCSLDLAEKDPDYVKLSEIYEDIEYVIKCSKYCQMYEQLKEVLEYAQKHLAPRLSFKRLEIEFQEKINKGQICQPKNAKYQNTSPLDTLKMFISKKKHKNFVDEDVNMEEMGQQGEETDSDLEATDDELAPKSKKPPPKQKEIKKPIEKQEKPKLILKTKEKVEKKEKVKAEKSAGAIKEKRAVKVQEKKEKAVKKVTAQAPSGVSSKLLEMKNKLKKISAEKHEEESKSDAASKPQSVITKQDPVIPKQKSSAVLSKPASNLKNNIQSKQGVKSKLLKTKEAPSKEEKAETKDSEKKLTPAVSAMKSKLGGLAKKPIASSLLKSKTLQGMKVDQKGESATKSAECGENGETAPESPKAQKTVQKPKISGFKPQNQQKPLIKSSGPPGMKGIGNTGLNNNLMKKLFD